MNVLPGLSSFYHHFINFEINQNKSKLQGLVRMITTSRVLTKQALYLFVLIKFQTRNQEFFTASEVSWNEGT